MFASNASPPIPTFLLFAVTSFVPALSPKYTEFPPSFNDIFPTTCKASVGVVVPIPTLPVV